MMQQLVTMRHPIAFILFGALVAVLVLYPIKVVDAADVATSVEGENFDVKPTGTKVVTDAMYQNGKALEFTDTVQATENAVTFSSEGDVVLIARADQKGGSPKLRVSVNGTFTAPAQAITNSGAPQPYTFDVNAPSGSVQIGVKAANTGSGRHPFLDYASFPASGGGGGTDTTPPETSITSADLGTTNDNTPTFTFTGTDDVGVTGFECQVDTAGFVACTSPFTTAALPDGSHTFQVRAKDAAGNVDPTPASQTFTVDTDASSPSGGRPGVGTGVASDCDVTINPGTSTLQTALNNVPATISTNDYIICMHAGVYGALAQATDFGNTGDNSTHRLVLKSYPGEQTQFRGFLKATSGDAWYVIRDLYLDGRYEAPASGGGSTNAGNPDMMPVYAVAGSDVLFTNNDVDGGNDDRTVVSGSNPLNKRSTCIGYHQDPIRSTVSHNWIHNCGVLAASSASGSPDAHGLYTSNAANGGTVSDNFVWGNAEVGLNAFGTSVGPHGVIFEDNILWDNGKNMFIGGEASGNTVRNSLFFDWNIGNERNITGKSNGAPTDVIDNCLDSAIRATPVNTSGNVIVPDASMSFSGDPRNGNFTITTTSQCLAKYGGTMYP